MVSKRILASVLALTLVPVVGCTTAAARGRSSLDEARLMLDRAAEHYRTVGREQALRDFTDKKSPFVDRDLYVFCYGPDRKVSGHGADPRLIETDVDSLLDLDGQAFGSEIMRVAQPRPKAESRATNGAIP